MGGLTEGEQNQLIIDNVELPIWVISRSRKGRLSLRMRGVRKGIPYEELEATGMAALVEAARKCTQKKTFPAYADKVVEFAIIDFIDKWQEFEPLDLQSQESEKLIYEWQNFLFALYENWRGEPHTPESLLIAYEEVKETPRLIESALIGLSPFERKLIEAYFIRVPQRPLEQIARDWRMSYKRTNEAIYRALGKMRETIKNTKANKRQETTNIITFPARAVRPKKRGDRPNIKDHA